MLRIIGGEFRSRRLLAPPDEAVSRPYSDRVKESVFNLLRGWFEEGATVLDLFAGVGTMGLEAVSRGAARVVMVERNAAIFKLLQQNIKALGCGDRALGMHGDALGPLALAKAPAPLDIVFIDPPYELMQDERTRRRVLEQVANCRPLMGERGFVVLRSPIEPGGEAWAAPGFAGPEVHRYGQEMRVLLYAPAALPAPAAPASHGPAGETPTGSFEGARGRAPDAG